MARRRKDPIAVSIVVTASMIKFDKVSFEQYCKDRIARSSVTILQEEMALEYDAISLPKRGTLYSAGYDIRTPFDVKLEPGESVVIPTGLRSVMEPDMWLGIYIRSSLGFKHGVRLLNSVAVIDADYSGAANEGHLMVGIYNGGDHTVELKAQDAFAQGIFQKYYITDDDEPVNQVRKGGFGSTNA